ncbi:hypothetical protein, partial [Campylobacter hyointestinalis]|uniref:hypothetical protein n=1 Tax=Campylobacter hyointestinalis TaxID=198 RepID=UPI000D4EB64B
IIGIMTAIIFSMIVWWLWIMPNQIPKEFEIVESSNKQDAWIIIPIDKIETIQDNKKFKAIKIR